MEEEGGPEMWPFLGSAQQSRKSALDLPQQLPGLQGALWAPCSVGCLLALPHWAEAVGHPRPSFRSLLSPSLQSTSQRGLLMHIHHFLKGFPPSLLPHAGQPPQGGYWILENIDLSTPLENHWYEIQTHPSPQTPTCPHLPALSPCSVEPPSAAPRAAVSSPALVLPSHASPRVPHRPPPLYSSPNSKVTFSWQKRVSLSHYLALFLLLFLIPLPRFEVILCYRLP